MIFIYGPPGSGKSAIGKALADQLRMPFYDLDSTVETQAGMPIPEIFNQVGESGFRNQEGMALSEVVKNKYGVVALGGGSLLNPDSRKLVEAAGPVLCLSAGLDTLISRLSSSTIQRPLLSSPDQKERVNSGDSTSSIPSFRQRLEDLLLIRTAHYDSFPVRLNTTDLSLEESAWEAQVRLGSFYVRGMTRLKSGDDLGGYVVRVQEHGIDKIGTEFSLHKLQGPVAIICDEVIFPLYAFRIVEALQASGYTCVQITIPAGEPFKTIETVTHLWERFTAAGLERDSTLLAVGGGVVSDVAGFAASAYMRGIDWVVLPTTLLAMVDASLGGKTGVNLPQGKNLVGAFYPPRLVIADPTVLDTLSAQELRAGLAEVVKAGIVGDPALFERCSLGWEEVTRDWGEIVRRAMAVKIKVIRADPYEDGYRAVLNYGHTIGHAIERVSDYSLRHGEAVAMGMVVEAKLAKNLGVTRDDLADPILEALVKLGLRTTIPPQYDRQAILEATQTDKKRRQRMARFALPICIGQVQHGIQVEDREIMAVLIDS